MTAYVVETTAAGTGAIAVLEVVGPDAQEAVARAFGPHLVRSHRPLHTLITDADGELDDVVIACRPPDKSMTGWLHVEIQCHGSPAIVKRVRRALVAVGVKPAPRSFLLRTAVRNRRMTRLEEEAWLAAMSALTDRAANELWEQRDCLPRAAKAIGQTRKRGLILDLLETADHGFMLTHPRRVAIVGPSNTGKSTLVNALVGRERVLADARPGTTRDVVEVPIAIRGIPFVLLDTAGWRDTDDFVEGQGVELGRRAALRADLRICCVDHAHPVRPPLPTPTIPLWTKSDLEDREPPAWVGARVSAVRGDGVERLRETILKMHCMPGPVGPEGGMLFTLRQVNRARELLECPDSEWEQRWERWVWGRPSGAR